MQVLPSSVYAKLFTCSTIAPVEMMGNPAVCNNLLLSAEELMSNYIEKRTQHRRRVRGQAGKNDTTIDPWETEQHSMQHYTHAGRDEGKVGGGRGNTGNKDNKENEEDEMKSGESVRSASRSFVSFFLKTRTGEPTPLPVLIS